MRVVVYTFFVIVLSLLPLEIFAQIMGADQMDRWIDPLQGKRVGLVVNQTSTLTNGTHLIDALIARNIEVTTLFSPEHGLRGNADAGETVRDGKDTKTGIEIVSLYGKNKKPTAKMLHEVDVLIFDIQDVGARFYTYTSTLLYVMQAAAELDKEMIVLDRPNPNDVVDGEVLDLRYKSFVGLLPIPLLHGVTVGELALMIQGEGWTQSDQKVKLTVVPMKGWRHGDTYSLPIKPSPNLPNDLSIALYPSLCFFEGTIISVGRGTSMPFQVIGANNSAYGKFMFMPIALDGFDKNPLYKNEKCYGMDLRHTIPNVGIDLSYLITMYRKSPDKENFFLKNNFIHQLSGSSKLKEQIIKGNNEIEIRESWNPELEKYKMIRKKYLLYDEY